MFVLSPYGGVVVSRIKRVCVIVGKTGGSRVVLESRETVDGHIGPFNDTIQHPGASGIKHTPLVVLVSGGHQFTKYLIPEGVPGRGGHQAILVRFGFAIGTLDDRDLVMVELRVKILVNLKIHVDVDAPISVQNEVAGRINTHDMRRVFGVLLYEPWVLHPDKVLQIFIIPQLVNKTAKIILDGVLAFFPDRRPFEPIAWGCLMDNQRDHTIYFIINEKRNTSILFSFSKIIVLVERNLIIEKTQYS